MRTINAGPCAAILFAVMSMAACQKTGNSPATTSSQLSFQMQADNAATTLATAPVSGNRLITNSVNTSVAGLAWTAGVANISRFKLEAKKSGVETEVVSRN